jgi:hypothetical protein
VPVEPFRYGKGNGDAAYPVLNEAPIRIWVDPFLPVILFVTEWREVPEGGLTFFRQALSDIPVSPLSFFPLTSPCPIIKTENSTK